MSSPNTPTGPNSRSLPPTSPPRTSRDPAAASTTSSLDHAVSQEKSSPRHRNSVSFAPDTTTSSKRNSARIIRTFEEVEVQKLVMAEEWYEELECGICSHVLGGPQTLIPCGHTFCGTCAWQWIKTNKNLTCPHCRMQLDAITPFVPNIIVDQIIERKLRSLQDGQQKTELLEERREKSDAWKVLQASLPAKAAKRSKALDDWMMGFFDHGPSASEAVGQGHRRRASRHLNELGAVIPQARRPGNILTQGGMSLGDIRRLDAEEDAMIASRHDAPWLSTRGGPPSPANYENASRARFARPPLVSIPSGDSDRPADRATNSNLEESLPQALRLQPDAPRQNTGNVSHGRLVPLRSQALAARQARGRTGSRDHPLVVLSDSEDEHV